MRIIFTPSFSSSPNVQSFAYLLFYPIVLHSFLIFLRVLTICQSCLHLLTFGCLLLCCVCLPWIFIYIFELLSITYILRWIGATECVWTYC